MFSGLKPCHKHIVMFFPFCALFHPSLLGKSIHFASRLGCYGSEQDPKSLERESWSQVPASIRWRDDRFLGTNSCLSLDRAERDAEAWYLVETPGQYKKRAKQGVAPEATDNAPEGNEEPRGDESWFRPTSTYVFGNPGWNGYLPAHATGKTYNGTSSLLWTWVRRRLMSPNPDEVTIRVDVETNWQWTCAIE